MENPKNENVDVAKTEDVKRNLMIEREKLVRRERELIARHATELGDEATTEHTRGIRGAGDLAAVTRDQEVGIEMAENLWGRIREIDEALARLEAGTWGVCTECEGDIEPARLHALPMVPLCRNCQMALEQDQARIREGAHTHLSQITQ